MHLVKPMHEALFPRRRHGIAVGVAAITSPDAREPLLDGGEGILFLVGGLMIATMSAMLGRQAEERISSVESPPSSRIMFAEYRRRPSKIDARGVVQ